MQITRVLPTRADVAAQAGSALIDQLAELLKVVTDRPVDLAIAGGFVATDVLAAARGRADEVDWTRVRVWPVDERWVPSESPERNDRAAERALLSEHIRVNDRWMPASDEGMTPDEAVARYTQLWEAEVGDRGVDLAVVGMGEDGHWASLFPHSPLLDEAGPVLFVDDSPKPPPERLTLSLSALLASSEVWVCAAGEGKAAALEQVFADEPDERAVPIAALRGDLAPSMVTWWLDVPAGSLID